MYDIEKTYQPKTIDEAIENLVAEPKAEIIAGGTDVLVKVREGGLAGATLVSIHEIPELRGISMKDDGTIVIKAATCFADITRNPIIQKNIPTLGKAVDTVGGPQIREMGTIGGNTCNGVTSADSASTLMALNAQMEVKGPKGTRIIPITEWYAGPSKTVREHDEVLVSVQITKDNYEGFHGCYLKYGKRNAMEIATLGCSVHLKLSDDKKTIADFRVGYGVAGPNPMRCPKTEEKVKGMPLNDDLLETIAEGALQETKPRNSWRASEAFRRQIIAEFGRRATAAAINEAGGKLNA
ncbi:MAG: xanthine dehydrogenase FAD-binding subunit XdhB [Enterococcaceae bacterium]|jgi:xanthine dehydrogenase FAD-binding subunit|nr:xanthine dehydrogenase FAD-binding subunit XdhB [Enterococcaceae bacterium]MCI1920222.1 xanthine dehydrogenase FAD-binding subunit XdhB [Enterococcaceae bacterium]